MRLWTADYRFAWAPVIAFGVKRLRFMERIDEMFEPTAFGEAPEFVGVAVGHPAVRLTIRQTGMRLSDGAASDDGVSSVLPLVDVVFDILHPQDVVFQSSGAAYTAEIAGDYAEATRRFAQSQVNGPLEAELQPSDSATLMDIQSVDFDGQAEFGIVDRDELRQRLANDTAGRIHARPSGRLDSVNEGEFPRLSLFVDINLRARNIQPTRDIADIKDRIATVNSLGDEFANALFRRSFIAEEESHDVR